MKFLKAENPRECFEVEHWMRVAKQTREEAQRIVDGFKHEQVYLSDCGTYQVNVREHVPGHDWPIMLHLSIKRCDREPLGDWRIKQQIKDAILGPDSEAVELYPADARLVDTANQYHLYGFSNPEHRFPFGYQERLVMQPEELPMMGSKQREFEPGKGDGVFLLHNGDDGPEWQIRIDGEVLPVTWNTKGAALAGLEVERRRRAARKETMQ